MRKTAFVMVIFLVLNLLPTFAERPDAPPYAIRGAFPVGSMEFKIDDPERPLSVTVWYPALNPDELPEEITYHESLASMAGHALQDAEPDLSGAPYPLIVFSHGLGGLRFQSVFYVEHLASQGFVVIASEHPGSTAIDSFSKKMTAETVTASFAYRPLEIIRQIDLAETLTAPDGDLEGMIDTNTVGVTGHSFGGYTAMAMSGAQINTTGFDARCQEIATREENAELCDGSFLQIIAEIRGLDDIPDGLWPATTDPRIKAVVALAPAMGGLFDGGMSEVTMPVMIITGSADKRVVPETNAYIMYGQISSSQKALVSLENGGHYIFVETCTDQMIAFGYFGSCSDLVWDMERAHDLTDHFATAFFLGVLKGDTDALAALSPDQVDFTGVEYQTSLP